MDFRLEFTTEALANMDSLKSADQKARLKAVTKCLGYLETNPKHPSLQSQPYQTLTGPNDEKVFESYAQLPTPGAYRVFWYYSKNKKGTIVVFSIAEHP